MPPLRMSMKQFQKISKDHRLDKGEKMDFDQFLGPSIWLIGKGAVLQNWSGMGSSNKNLVSNRLELTPKKCIFRMGWHPQSILQMYEIWKKGYTWKTGNHWFFKMIWKMSFLSWDVDPAEVCSKWQFIAIRYAFGRDQSNVKSIRAPIKKHMHMYAYIYIWHCLKDLKGFFIERSSCSILNLGAGFQFSGVECSVRNLVFRCPCQQNIFQNDISNHHPELAHGWEIYVIKLSPFFGGPSHVTSKKTLESKTGCSPDQKIKLLLLMMLMLMLMYN